MDEHGFRQAFHEHKNSVYAFAYRMTNSAAAADDITQDCFLELFGRPERFDPARGSLRNYLLSVARNLALKRWRRENRFRRWTVSKRFTARRAFHSTQLSPSPGRSSLSRRYSVRR